MPLTPKISSAIPQQNFEIIGVQIGGILLAEFLNQKVNFSLPARLCPATVGIEDFSNIDEETFPAMVVSFVRGKRDIQYTGGDSVFQYYYNIDVYTGRAGSSSETGWQLAVSDLKRMLGLVRAILENPVYDNLALPDSYIRNVHVEDIISAAPFATGDASNPVMGRVILAVLAPEDCTPVDGVPAEIGGTIASLRNSDNKLYWGVFDEE